MTQEYAGFLAHYGVKGQKWGVRNWQNEDGTYTEEGKHHYGWGHGRQPRMTVPLSRRRQTRTARQQRRPEDGRNPSANQAKTTISTSASYRTKPGTTQEEIEKNKETARTILKIAAGVTVAAALAYGGYKAYKHFGPLMDRTIKSGKELQRVTVNSTEQFDRPFYAADNKADYAKYIGALGKTRLSQVKSHNEAFQHTPYKGKMRQGPPIKESVYEIVGKTTGNIKMAGDKAGKKAYEHLLKTDNEFRRIISNNPNMHNSTPASMKGNSQSPMNQYKLFNRELASNRPDQRVAQKKFYNELKNRGYGAVADVNDRDFSMYKSKAKIIFDTDKVKRVGIKEIDEQTLEPLSKKAQDVFKRQAKRDIKISKAQKIVKRILYGGAVSTAASGTAVLSINAQDRAAIRKYKKDHPNTKMTDREILKSLRG